MKKTLLLLLLNALAYHCVSAQCASTVLSPGANTTLQVGDTGSNNSELWNMLGVVDQQNLSANLAETAVEPSLTVLQQCVPAVSCELYLDLDNNQTAETLIPSDSFDAYPAGFIRAFNLLPGASLMYQFDKRTIAAPKYQFAIQTTVSGDTTVSKLVWISGANNAPVQLPLGKHKIVWQVDGNSITQHIEVKDTGLPTVVCINGLSINLMLTQPSMVMLFASDFLQYSEDNTTPTNLLQIAIRKQGAGTGFPLNSDGNPQTSVVFTCADLGTQLVELWSRDKAGNANKCDTYVLVQDNLGGCSGIILTGTQLCTRTETGEPISGVSYEISVDQNGLPPFNLPPVISNGSGCANVPNAWPIASNLTFVPHLDEDPLNGVTTFDLVLISRHILGLTPLNTPYKIIAADANKSGTITNFDIVELRKLILGIYTELPNIESWRFVDMTQVFTNPLNPFFNVLQESATGIGGTNSVINFVGMKVGDVNNTAIPNFQSENPDDRSPLHLVLPDRVLTAGQTHHIPVYLSVENQLVGTQLTLEFAPGTQVLNVIPNIAINGMTDEVFSLQNSQLNVSWVSGIPQSLNQHTPLFWLDVTTSEDLPLNTVIQLSTTQLAAEAYTLPNLYDVQQHPLELLFGRINADGPTVYTVMPNPTKGDARILLQSPYPVEATILVMSTDGKLVHSRNVLLNGNIQEIIVPGDAMNSSGLYYWKLITGDQIETSGKILKQ